MAVSTNWGPLGTKHYQSMCVCMYVWMYVCMFVCMCVFLCVFCVYISIQHLEIDRLWGV